MKLFAGFDGGGTKTACVLTDEKGNLLGTGLGGPSNYLYCGKEMAAQSVDTALNQAFGQAGLERQTLAGAFMASAAILHQHGQSHVPFFQTCMDTEYLECDGDITPLWYGGVGSRPGVVSIAGTGAVTYVCRQESSIRVSGWGPLLGDEGSGYDLGLHALRTACRMYDGRSPMDQVFLDGIFENYGVETPHQLLRKLNRGDTRSLVASAAKAVFALYNRGNSTAGDLLRRCAEEIAIAVTTVVERDTTGEILPLVLSGSIVHPDRALFPMVEQAIRSRTDRISEICYPVVHPAVSSAAIVLERLGYPDAAKNLMENAKGVLL